IPANRLVAAGGDSVAVREDGLSGAVGYGDVDIRICRDTQIPGGQTMAEGRCVALDDCRLADESQRLSRLGGLLQSKQRAELIVGPELLLHACKLHQLLG